MPVLRERRRAWGWYVRGRRILLLRVHVDRGAHCALHVYGRMQVICVGGSGDHGLGGVRRDVTRVWRIVWLGWGIVEVLRVVVRCR